MPLCSWRGQNTCVYGEAGYKDGNCGEKLKDGKTFFPAGPFAGALIAAVRPFLLGEMEDHVDLHARVDELVEIEDEGPTQVRLARVGIEHGRQGQSRGNKPDQDVPEIDRIGHRGEDGKHGADHHSPHGYALIDDAPPDEKRHRARAEGDGPCAVSQHIAGPATEILHHAFKPGALDDLDRVDRGVGDIGHLRVFREQVIPGGLVIAGQEPEPAPEPVIEVVGLDRADEFLVHDVARAEHAHAPRQG